MKKIDKSSAFAVVLALMLVVSAVFYVGLRPTTAWFHNEYSVANTYDVGTFVVKSDAYLHRSMSLTFDATTKIDEALVNDSARNREFEYAVKYLYITVVNDMEENRSGTVDYLDALVKVNFDNQSLADGLRYFYFDCTGSVDPVANSRAYYEQASTDVNGLTAGGDLCSRMRTFYAAKDITADADYTDTSKNPKMDVQLNTQSFGSGAIRVPRNKQVTICIALWVDHGASGRVNKTFNTQITLSAQQTKST